MARDPVLTHKDVPVEKKLRADSQRMRDYLLDVVAHLLEEYGLDFSLPDLARESGVATATVYRHFDGLGDLRQEFYNRFIGRIAHELMELSTVYHGRELFSKTCHAWIEVAARWARSATFIRDAKGYLERVHAGDSNVGTLQNSVIRPVILELIASGEIPEQDPEYAGVIWITLFDERVIVDLTVSLGWDLERVAQSLEAALLAVLRSPAV